MSENQLIKPINVVDSRIDNIKSVLPFTVISGASKNILQFYPCNGTASTNAITYSCQIPNLETGIDRNVMHQGTINNTITCTGVPAGQLALNYGSTDSYQNFPLNSLITTQSITINNFTVTTDLQNTFRQLIKMFNPKSLQNYDSTTPAYYLYYADAVGSNQNPLAGITNIGYNSFYPRGSYNVTFGNIVHNIFGGGVDASLVSTNLADTWTIPISITVVEPIFMSPFLPNIDNSNDQSTILGVTTINATFNLDGACKRLFSTANLYITNITLNSVTNSNLIFNFLTLQPEQYGKIVAKNVVNYMDPMPYPFTFSTPIAAGAVQSINSIMISLNQVPDKLIIVCRIPMTSQNWSNSSSFISIQDISLSLMTQQGLLSTFTQQQLYLMSKKNGSRQSYYEFCGQMQKNNNLTGVPTTVPSQGSILIINPALDLGLESYYTASSQGQTQLSFKVTVKNNYNVNLPQVETIALNSGVFETQNGTSSANTGLLNRDVVLITKSEESVLDTSQYSEITGSGMNMHTLHPSIMDDIKHKVMLNKVHDHMVKSMNGSAMSGGSKPDPKDKKSQEQAKSDKKQCPSISYVNYKEYIYINFFDYFIILLYPYIISFMDISDYRKHISDMRANNIRNNVNRSNAIQSGEKIYGAGALRMNSLPNPTQGNQQPSLIPSYSPLNNELSGLPPYTTGRKPRARMQPNGAGIKMPKIPKSVSKNSRKVT